LRIGCWVQEGTGASQFTLLKVTAQGWMRWVVYMEGNRNAYRVLVRKAEGQRLLARLWHRWEENIKIDLSYIGYKCMGWINLTQDRDMVGGLL